MAGAETDYVHQIFTRFLTVLERTQWLEQPQIAQYQQGLVEALARHAWEHVPFHRDRLACLFTADGRCDLSRWHEIPVMTREEAALHATAMQAPRLADAYGPVHQIETSGTTGTPLTIASNRLNSIAANAALTRFARWWGADPSRPLARIRLYKKNGPQYPEGRIWKGWSHADHSTPAYDLDLMTPVDSQIEWLLRRRAPYLLTSPSNAMAIAYAATPEQARALDLQIVFSIAETVLPRAREVVAERLGAKLAGIYSCEEIGFIATQCPDTPGYHIVAENTHVELLRDDGRPASPGEIGQVVVTGLYNYAMPFIRYAIGDVAIAAEGPCACGRGLPVLAQILGRTRNAFVFEDGKRVWLRINDAQAIGEFVPFREFQMVQTDRRQIEFRYIPDGSGRAPDLAGLDALVRTRIHPSAAIKLIPMQAITRGPGGKLEPFITLVAD